MGGGAGYQRKKPLLWYGLIRANVLGTSLCYTLKHMGLRSRIKRKIASYISETPEFHTHWRLNKIFYLKELYDQIASIEGDIVECGVGYGDSLFAFSVLAAREGKGRRVWGFDSFEGFPETSIEDQSPRNPQKGQWGDATLEKLQNRIEIIKPGNIEIRKGFFEDTLPAYSGKIALLHIDADIYQSYKTALNCLFDKVEPRGIVAFDEYGIDIWPGATKAVDEFLKGEYDLHQGKGVKQYFLVK
jgi:hypothetical protein